MATDALPFLPVDSPDFWSDPERFMIPARRAHPWLARFAHGYVVHGCQALKHLFADDVHLQTGLNGIVDIYDARDTMWARFMDEMLISRSGADHARLRASAAMAFTPREADRIRPTIRTVMTDLLDTWAPRGAFEFTDFASYFPVAVMCGVLGVSADLVPGVRDALEMQVASLTLDPAMRPRIMAAWDSMWAFADRAVREREDRAGQQAEALLDRLIAARDAGQIDDVELRFMLLVLMVAGYDTSKNQLAMILNLLIDRPDMYQRCARDLDYCARVVEEALRHSAIATPFRQVVEAFDYDGVRFEAGALVAMATPLSGRDPAAFEDSMAFDPSRNRAVSHVAFGRGPHICIGQFLARVQLTEGLHLIAGRLPAPRRTGPVIWRPLLGAWGLKSLPIAFDSGG